MKLSTNALAERLDKGRWNLDVNDYEKAQRIVAELAKVKLNGVGWPVRVEVADAYENCLAIAEEG